MMPRTITPTHKAERKEDDEQDDKQDAMDEAVDELRRLGYRIVDIDRERDFMMKLQEHAAKCHCCMDCPNDVHLDDQQDKVPVFTPIGMRQNAATLPCQQSYEIARLIKAMPLRHSYGLLWSRCVLASWN